MNSPLADRNYLSSFILVITAAVLLLVVSFTDRRDVTSATVVISAMILFLTGIFLFTFAKKESLDNHFTSLLSVQGQINICRIASDLSIMGNAWFIPVEKDGEEIRSMQFMPVSTYQGGIPDGNSFVYGDPGTGILIPPAGEILMSDLRVRSVLVVPHSLEEILILIKKIGEELLEIAEPVKVQKSGDGISIILENYLLIDGCRKVAAESPACCTMNPCPICSLFGMVLAEGMNQPVMIERCRASNKDSRVEMLLTFYSLNDKRAVNTHK
jgi:hypothetical protein